MGRNRWWNKPIPIERRSTQGWKGVLLKPTSEPLVPIGPFTNYSLLGGTAIYAGQDTSSPYYPDGLKGSLLTHFVRRSVAKRLLIAALLLPKQYIFWLWDCYRPLEVQSSLYESCFFRVKTRHPDWNEDKVSLETQRFASIPSNNPLAPSPHNTGGAIDLTLAYFPSLGDWRKTRKLFWEVAKIRNIWGDSEKAPKWAWKKAFSLEMELWELYRQRTLIINMGTVFDAVKPETETAYFEKRLKAVKLMPHERPVLSNRRLLYWILKLVGFSSYEEEWWHFDRGNQFAAKRAGGNAFYGAANFSDDNYRWEIIRRSNWQRTLRILSGENVTNPPKKVWFGVKDSNPIKRPTWTYEALELSQKITPEVIRTNPKNSPHQVADII